MRISDWSSDVCSSDLPAGGTIRSVEIAQLPSSEWIINVRVSWRDDKWLNVCLWEQPTIKTYKRLSSAIRHVVFDYGYEDDHIRVVPNQECSNQIGRASCRERVGQ